MAIEKFRGKYRFLSNFWPAEVTFDGEEYESTEHAYQAAKTLDLELRKKFRATEDSPAPTAGETKKMARKITVRSDWEQVKLGIMEDLVRQKFQHEDLKAQLLVTGEEELIEGNTWGDVFWGRCDGVGENHLGRILMKIRTELRKQDELS
jgi:hypothetical protein